MQQLFQNLLSNAIAHMDKPKGQIEIGYKDKGALHEFSIKDNGVGIPKAYQEKIFEIFETLGTRSGSSGWTIHRKKNCSTTRRKHLGKE